VAISSPVSSGMTPSSPVMSSMTPGVGGSMGSVEGALLSTSPPRPFAHLGSPLNTNTHTSGPKPLPTVLYGSELTLTEYLQRLLPLAHVQGTTFAENARHKPTEGPTAVIASSFHDLASSSVPPQHLASAVADMSLPNPVEGLSMTPERVAHYDTEQCEYGHLLQVKAQFDALPELSSSANQAFAVEVSTLLSKLSTLLNGTKNASIQTHCIAMQQRITNPTFISQYTTQKSHPIASNKDLVELWHKLEEARVFMDSAREAIDRSVYTDEVRIALNNVISLAADVEEVVNAILAKLEALRVEYKNFPSVDELRATELGKLASFGDAYRALLQELSQSSEMLVKNGKILQAKYEAHKEELARRIGAADREALRLEREQNLLLAAMDLLGRMYIEHEVERQKQHQLSDLYTAKALALDEELSSFTEEAEKHTARVTSATKDTEAALQAVSLMKSSVANQMDLLQRWTNEAKEQHTEQGVRALREAHHTAMVKFEALVEIWDSANRSLEEITPEIKSLEAVILSASQARTQIKVEAARRQKKEFEDAIPTYQKTRDEANSALEHLEQVLFPTINTHLAKYGQPIFPLPKRV